MKLNKKIFIPILSLAIVLLLGIGGTFAILQSVTNKAENQFAHGVVNITIEEEFPGEEAKDNPGIYYKKVSILNDSKDGTLPIVDCFAAVKLVVNWVDNTDTTKVYPINDMASKITLLTEDESGNLKEGLGADWIKGEDGVYYYTKKLETSGEGIRSTALMTHVKVDADGLPKGGHLEINVLSQAVIAGNAKDYSEAWKEAKK